MTRREIAFLLIGLGVALPFAVIGFVDVISIWRHHMFILGFTWSPSAVLLVLPFLPLILGCILLYQDRSKV